MFYSLNWIQDWVSIDKSAETILDTLTNVGLTVEKSETIGDDNVFELDLTTNRPDCLSHLGVAREISASLNSPLKLPVWKFSTEGTPAEEKTSVVIEDKEACPRYACMIFHDVTISPSPPWLSNLLEKIGIRSINNVVDITNYVLAAIGQPLHSFDYDRLFENRIIVRRAREGELLETLDGVERKLKKEDLVIADGQNPVALAGIMGGSTSEIFSATKTVLLESAYFDPGPIRRTSRRLGISTEASQRFTRGQDPEIVLRALELAAHLFEKLNCGKPAPGVVDIYPEKISISPISLRRKRIEELFGISINETFVETTLNALGFTIEPSPDGWQVTAPSFRADITEEIDLMEEIVRHYGYNAIPSVMPSVRLGDHRVKDDVRLEERARDYAYSAGLTETISYVFQGEDENQWPQPLANLTPVRIQNPLSENAAFLRTTLLPGMLRTCKFNESRNQNMMAIFEIGQVYGRIEGGYESHLHLGILLSGSRDSFFGGKTESFTFFDLKGYVESIITRFDTTPLEWYPFEQDGFHPYQAAVAGWKGSHILYAGKIASENILFAEIHLPHIAPVIRHTRSFEAYSSFPWVPIDLTFGHSPEISYRDLTKTITDLKPVFLTRISLKDRYEVKDTDRVKTTLRLFFQSHDRSLTQEEVNEERDSIIEIVLKNPDVTFG